MAAQDSKFSTLLRYSHCISFRKKTYKLINCQAGAGNLGFRMKTYKYKDPPPPVVCRPVCISW